MPAPKRTKKGEVTSTEAENLLSAIQSANLSHYKLLELLGAHQPCCDPSRPCKANRKENPNCLCQIVPPEGSFRKKGLWLKDQTYLNVLGQDPVEQKRESPTTPAGLRNLGNTCYANAALQCLFSIPSLRNAVYGVEPQHDIMRQLRTLFMQMQFGPRASVDTEPMAKTLGLSHAVQQDGQEFLKLLLTRVEQFLGQAANPEAKQLVRELFRGGYSWVTTCQRCGRASPSSSKEVDYYELTPHVKEFKSLMSSLAAMLHTESLSGDNQYLCEHCGTKVDALRCQRLRSLPPYLCLALQRFYFNMQTLDKAKATDKFAFPLELDFGKVVAAAAAAAEAAGVTGAAPPPLPEAPWGLRYRLTAILIHKGNQASSGHYVAHIQDQASGRWWRYDDEVVEDMGDKGPAAFPADHGVASTVPGAEKAATGPDAGAAGKDAGGGKAKGAKKQPGDAPKAATGKRQASGKAGAATGRARAAKRGPGAAAAAAAAAGEGDDCDAMELDEDAMVKLAIQQSLVPGAAALVAAPDEDMHMELALKRSMEDARAEARNMEAALAASMADAGAPPPAAGGAPAASAVVKPEPKQQEFLAAAAPAGEAAGTAAAAAATASGGGAAAAADEVVSSNAYMLVYRAVGWEEPPVLSEAARLPLDLQQELQAAVGEYERQCRAYQQQRQAMVDKVEARRADIREQISAMPMAAPAGGTDKSAAAASGGDAGHGQGRQANGCAGREGPGGTRGAKASGRQQPAQPVARQGSGQNADADAEDDRWVATAWLERWANDEAVPPAIDNGPLLCKAHAEAPGSSGGGAVASSSRWDPSKCTAAKRITSTAWAKLQAQFGGGPELATRDVCRECLKGRFSTQLLGEQAEAVRKRVGALLDQPDGQLEAQAELEARQHAEEQAKQAKGHRAEQQQQQPGEQAEQRGQYYVSRAWLQGWVKRSGTSTNTDKSPTQDLVCPHGRLLPLRQFKGARRVPLPADVWCFVVELWRQQVAKDAAAKASRRASKGGGDAGAPEVVVVLDDDAPPAGSPTPPPDSDGGEGPAPMAEDDAGGDDDDVLEVQEVPAPSGGAAVGAATAPPAQCVELRVGACYECDECAGVAGQQQEVEASAKRRQDEERRALGMLAADQSSPLEIGCTYYMVPTGWLRDWQAYMKQGPKRAPPGWLLGAMQPLLCSCHRNQPRLAFKLPELALRRGRVHQLNAETDPVRLVTESDWLALVNRYGFEHYAVPEPPANQGQADQGQQQPAASASASSGTATTASGAPHTTTPGLEAAARGFAAAVIGTSAMAPVVPPAPAEPTTMEIDVDSEQAAAAPAGGDEVVMVCCNVEEGGQGQGEVEAAQRAADGKDGDFCPEAEAEDRRKRSGTAGSSGRQLLRGRRESSAPAGASAPAAAPPPPPSALNVQLEAAHPPVCWDALADAERAAREAAFCYADVEVMVELVTSEELEGSFRDAAGAERKSKRSRKGRAAIKVSNTTTLEQLKLQIWQELGVHPRNQQVYMRGGSSVGCCLLLEDDALSLAQHEVLPDQELRVVRLNNTADDDYSSLATTGKGKTREKETGFKNTALHGDISQQAATPEGPAAADGGAGGSGAAAGDGEAAPL